MVTPDEETLERRQGLKSDEVPREGSQEPSSYFINRKLAELEGIISELEKHQTLKSKCIRYH